MAAPYKLRCNVVGHKKDVRSLTSSLFPEGGIISGSRDCTTRLWFPNDHDVGFSEGQILQGHSNFVAAVCVLPPDDKHPSGLIVTGSNDSTILMFEPGQIEAVHKLMGHSNTVCALAAGKFGFLLSGSWDKTAKVWLNQQCVMTLEGHESAVWAVAVMSEKGVMLTGSADKTIKMWRAGKCERTFNGHEDCVRGLVVAEEGVFLSCSNDATIRRWLTTGDCVNVYYGHANYVYSLALLPNGVDFVTSGEDRTVRVWRNGECTQTIPHPTQSVWCVCTLPNGDIVTGASDGVMRVFTTAAERMASSEDQKAFEDLVASSAIPTQLGDINKDDLPGPEALLNPGRKEGQTKMVRQGDHVELYSWDTSKSEWTKIGDVVGSSGGTQATSGKTLFEGKEYDYVFDVDIEEGKPPLKLAYNITEDPWFAAQAFLHRYSLSQLFLDQVANFITQNAKGVTLGVQSSGYSDPFTGGNRYVPGSGGADGEQRPAATGVDPFTGANSYQPASNTQTVGGGIPAVGADPFTGAGSYRPGGASTAPASGGNSYFPVTNFLALDTVNPKQIIGKLEEFNKTVPTDKQVDAALLNGLEQLLSGKATEAQLATLQRLLEWPADKVFPALDILRVGVKFTPVCHHFVQQQGFLDFLCKYLPPGNLAPNQMLVLRTVANLFHHPEGAKLLLDNQSQVMQCMLLCDSVTTKNAQIALSTAVLNFSVAATTAKNFDLKSECAAAAAHLLKKDFDSEAMFRLLVAVGTLVHGDEGCQAVVQSLDLGPALEKLVEMSDLNKVKECADLLLKS